MANFYKQFINKNDLCFDIGANIGERTDIFLKLGAKVITVEPQESCVKVLKKKYHNNKLIVIKEQALGSNKRISRLNICDETTECSTLSEEFVSTYSRVSGFHWNKTIEIEVNTLDNLIEQFGIPKLIKLDVEGYESEVFKGLSTNVKFMCFEFNQPLLADTIKCLELIETLGNYRWNFIKYEIMKLALPQWIPLNDFKHKINQIIPSDILTGEIIVEAY